MQALNYILKIILKTETEFHGYGYTDLVHPVTGKWVPGPTTQREKMRERGASTAGCELAGGEPIGDVVTTT